MSLLKRVLWCGYLFLFAECLGPLHMCVFTSHLYFSFVYLDFLNINRLDVVTDDTFYCLIPFIDIFIIMYYVSLINEKIHAARETTRLLPSKVGQGCTILDPSYNAIYMCTAFQRK